ncbi:MAG: hypothetical protein QN188_01865, partial [Armatimonadota bacterium]|nr:hypothetical protein [Armatimonadota bacterium]
MNLPEGNDGDGKGGDATEEWGYSSTVAAKNRSVRKPLHFCDGKYNEKRVGSGKAEAGRHR